MDIKSLFRKTFFAYALSIAASCLAQSEVPLKVDAVSSRPSLLFTDNEPVRIKARVEGGSGSVVVECIAKDSCGDWTAVKTLAIHRKGSEMAEAELPLKFPGRGYFKLELTAKCGDATARNSIAAGIVYQPLPATVSSPWGIMYGVYKGFPPGFNVKDRPACIAENMRMLGASWTRLNFWAHTYKVEVKDGVVALDLSRMRQQVDEFRKRGINILGEIVQTPRVLSSKPEAEERKGLDAGPLYVRVKPADYKLWDQLVEQIAKEFKNDIQVWEVWNEVDYVGHYWAGTIEEYLELLEHTGVALRKGNPSAKVAAAGFTRNFKAAIPFFEAGFGKGVDILTVHYTEQRDGIPELQKLQGKYGLSLPIQNTEESIEIPLNNLSHGIRTFKFIHMLDYLPTLRPLMKTDWQLHAAAVAYSVGAHLIGDKKFRRVQELPGFKVYFFGEEGDLAVITPYSYPVRLMNGSGLERIRVKAIPAEGREMLGVDALGREGKLPGGGGEIPFPLNVTVFDESQDDSIPQVVFFIRNCKEIVSVEGVSSAAKDIVVAEAEDGEFDGKSIAVIADKEYSGGKYLNISRKEAPGVDGYGVDLKMNVPADGNYRVCFSGNSLSRLAAPASVSSFEWSFDGGSKNLAGGKALKVRRYGIEGAPAGISELGMVHLLKGPHVFRLRLTAPREQPDQNWALWIDSIALVPVQQ